MPHLETDLYLRVLRGELPPRALVDAGFRHLLEVCEVCRDDWETSRRLPAGTGDSSPPPPLEASETPETPERPETTDATASAYGAPARRLDERRKLLAQSRRRARRDYRELMQIPREQRPDRVARARARFRSRGLAELMLEESRRLVRSDPEEAVALARLAGTVLLWTPHALEQPWGQALHALGLGRTADALRVAGHLDEAAATFLAACRFLAQHPVDDPELHGEIATLEASLGLDQRPDPPFETP